MQEGGGLHLGVLRLSSASQLGVEREGGMLLDGIFKGIVAAPVHLLSSGHEGWKGKRMKPREK